MWRATGFTDFARIFRYGKAVVKTVRWVMQKFLFVVFWQHKNLLFCGGFGLFGLWSGLFADTKFRENPAQEIIAGEGSGDFSKRLLRQPQLFGK